MPEPTNAAEQEVESIYRLYAGLARELDPDTGLGGKLLWAGEPTASACQLVHAANIAGATSLAASADAPALRRAMREGALDFVVTSLDEALRILKNEIRKKQPVAVGVSMAPEAMIGEMLDRGVQPDLLAPQLDPAAGHSAFFAKGARIVAPQPIPPGLALHIFSIPPDWKQPTAAFDALLLDCLAPEDHVNRRWVRLAPSYLPASARRLRSVVCDPGAASQFIARLATRDIGNRE